MHDKLGCAGSSLLCDSRCRADATWPHGRDVHPARMHPKKLQHCGTSAAAHPSSGRVPSAQMMCPPASLLAGAKNCRPMLCGGPPARGRTHGRGRFRQAGHAKTKPSKAWRRLHRRALPPQGIHMRIAEACHSRLAKKGPRMGSPSRPRGRKRGGTTASAKGGGKKPESPTRQACEWPPPQRLQHNGWEKQATAQQGAARQRAWRDGLPVVVAGMPQAALALLNHRFHKGLRRRAGRGRSWVGGMQQGHRTAGAPQQKAVHRTAQPGQHPPAPRR